MENLAPGDKESLEAFIAAQREACERDGQEERAREKDPLAPGRWVTLQGLQAAHLNDCIGEIIAAQNDAGRIGVRVKGQGNKLVKVDHLRPFADEDTLKVARVGCRGEPTAPMGPGGVRTWRWPRSVLDEMPSEACPMSELIGVPLRITRAEPHQELSEDGARDNFWASSLMTLPDTGLSPITWQCAPGPVIVWRPGGEPLSADDVAFVRSFIDSLLGQYPDLDVPKAITPEAFQAFKLQKLAEEKLSPLMEQSEDVNI